MTFIRHLASDIIDRHGTNDPYKICIKEEIVVICEPLGNIRGYYHEIEGVKMIHVNEKLSATSRKITICNLLYAHFRNKRSMLIGETCEDSFEKDANIFTFVLMNPKIDQSIRHLIDVFRSTNVNIEQWFAVMLNNFEEQRT